MCRLALSALAFTLLLAAIPLLSQTNTTIENILER